MASSATFKSLSVGNCLFLALFLHISAGMGAFLTPLTPSATTPCPGTPPEPLTTTAAWRQVPLCAVHDHRPQQSRRFSENFLQ
jgi:hypothetical protein